MLSGDKFFKIVKDYNKNMIVKYWCCPKTVSGQKKIHLSKQNVKIIFLFFISK